MITNILNIFITSLYFVLTLLLIDLFDLINMSIAHNSHYIFISILIAGLLNLSINFNLKFKKRYFIFTSFIELFFKLAKSFIIILIFKSIIIQLGMIEIIYFKKPVFTIFDFRNSISNFILSSSGSMVFFNNYIILFQILLFILFVSYFILSFIDFPKDKNYSKFIKSNKVNDINYLIHLDLMINIMFLFLCKVLFANLNICQKSFYIISKGFCLFNIFYILGMVVYLFYPNIELKEDKDQSVKIRLLILFIPFYSIFYLKKNIKLINKENI